MDLKALADQLIEELLKGPYKDISSKVIKLVVSIEDNPKKNTYKNRA